MVYSDISTKLGIVEEIDSLCDTDSTSYPLASKTRRINSALEEVVGWLMNADGVWQFDDENFSTVPEGTTDLVVGQSDYSFASTFLDLLWVKVKNTSGYWNILNPIDQSQTDHPLEDYLVTNGFPCYYDKLGDVIRLYPAPDATSVTLTAGLKVGFKRTGSLFAATDTTKVPGFASPYHVILAYMAAIPYCQSYKQNRVALFQAKVNQLKTDLINFYTNREKDTRKVISSAPISFR